MTSLQLFTSSRSSGRTVATATVGLAVLMSLTGCESERSAAKFCSTAKAEQSRLSAKYQQQAGALGTTQDPMVGLLGALVMVAGAQGDLVVYFDRLDSVAPDDIRPEVQAVRDAFKQQAEASQKVLSDPLGSLTGGLLSGLQASGSIQRVDEYTRQNCGVSI